MDTPPLVESRVLPRQRHALAGLVLLAMWLGWTVPAMWSQRPQPEPLGWTAQQVLAQVPASLLATTAGRGPVLLRGASHCRCAVNAPLPALPDAGKASSLAFEWLVLDTGQRVVYAGPALIPRACGTGALSALPLIHRLLATPQPPVVLSDRCSCRQE